MKKVIVTMVLALFSFGLIHGMDTRPFKKFYTLQAATMYDKDCWKAYDLYIKLKDEKQMVYYIRDKEGPRVCVRVRVGVFGAQDDAKTAAVKFKADTQMSAIIVETTGITITDYKGKFDMINTPSGIWMWDYKDFKEVKNFGKSFNCEVIAAENPVAISPDGKYIVYLYEGKLTKIEISSGKETDIVKPMDPAMKLERSSPKWSPDGKYVAFLDIMNAKAGTCLRVVKADGTDEKCVIDNSKKTRAVMAFEWGPVGNELYYVEGVTTMRVPIGGELYVTGLDGKSKLLVQPEKGSVIYRIFEFDGNKLNYNIAVFKGKSKDEYNLVEKTLKIN